MAKVSNKFFITTIQDGQTITVSLIFPQGGNFPNCHAGSEAQTRKYTKLSKKE